MKSATIPPLRVTPELRQDAQSVLKEGETLSSFAEEALRNQIANRKCQQEFLARGLAARDRAKATGKYVSKQDVMSSLQSIPKRRNKAREFSTSFYSGSSKRPEPFVWISGKK